MNTQKAITAPAATARHLPMPVAVALQVTAFLVGVGVLVLLAYLGFAAVIAYTFRDFQL